MSQKQGASKVSGWEQIGNLHRPYAAETPGGLGGGTIEEFNPFPDDPNWVVICIRSAGLKEWIVTTPPGADDVVVTGDVGTTTSKAAGAESMSAATQMVLNRVSNARPALLPGTKVLYHFTFTPESKASLPSFGFGKKKAPKETQPDFILRRGGTDAGTIVAHGYLHSGGDPDVNFLDSRGSLKVHGTGRMDMGSSLGGEHEWKFTTQFHDKNSPMDKPMKFVPKAKAETSQSGANKDAETADDIVGEELAIWVRNNMHKRNWRNMATMRYRVDLDQDALERILMSMFANLEKNRRSGGRLARMVGGVA